VIHFIRETLPADARVTLTLRSLNPISLSQGIHPIGAPPVLQKPLEPDGTKCSSHKAQIIMVPLECKFSLNKVITLFSPLLQNRNFNTSGQLVLPQNIFSHQRSLHNLHSFSFERLLKHLAGVALITIASVNFFIIATHII